MKQWLLGVVEAIYKLKYVIFCVQKLQTQRKLKEFHLNLNSLFPLSEKIDNQIPNFPCAVAWKMLLISLRESQNCHGITIVFDLGKTFYLSFTMKRLENCCHQYFYTGN